MKKEQDSTKNIATTLLKGRGMVSNAFESGIFLLSSQLSTEQQEHLGRSIDHFYLSIYL